MSVVKLTAIDGNGSTLDRTAELCEAIKDACYDIGNGMPLAAVIGCLEIAKAEILEEQRQ